MTRLIYNGIRAALASGLTSSATTITLDHKLIHSGNVDVPTLSGGDYIPLAILNLDGELTEIVHLTAYTAAATTGTISRGQEGTTGTAASTGFFVVGAPMVADIPAAVVDASETVKGIVELATTTEATTGTDTARAVTPAGVKAALDALIAAAPGALNTLDELAAALGDDANFAATMTTALAGKQASDADLTAIAALTTTSYGRALLELANQAALMALISAASDTVQGKVELATTTEATTGTDTARAVTPAGLKAAVDAAIAALINSAPGALDTLDELAAAFGDDPNFAATMTTALAGKQASDADLTAIAALTTTSYGRALLELTNQAALMALIPDASTTVKGKVELATDAETSARTDATRAVTPHGLDVALALVESSFPAVAPMVFGQWQYEGDIGGSGTNPPHTFGGASLSDDGFGLFLMATSLTGDQEAELDALDTAGRGVILAFFEGIQSGLQIVNYSSITKGTNGSPEFDPMFTINNDIGFQLPAGSDDAAVTLVFIPSAA